MKQHPLSAAFPAMSDSDFEALVADIRAHGQREAVIVFDGAILDGWHRFQACKVAKIECATEEHDGSDPVAFVMSRNLHRRHLTGSQRAAAVVSAASWKPPGRPEKNPAVTAGFSTTAAMAKAADVGERTIRQAKVAHDAGLGDAVRDGMMSAETAAAVATGKQPTPTETARKPAVPPEAEQLKAQLAEMREALAEAADEIQRLSAASDGKDETAVLVKNLQAELRAVKARRDDLMRENSELKRQIHTLERNLAKASKK